MTLVLEEGQNLALGLAMRGVNWQAMGSGSGLAVSMRTSVQRLHASTHARKATSSTSATITIIDLRMILFAVCCNALQAA